LRNELKLSWRKIARSLGTSVRKVRRVFAEIPGPTLPAAPEALTAVAPFIVSPKKNRRGRPLAHLNAAEVIRLREECGMSWRQIGKKLSARVSTVRRAYARTQTTATCAEIRSTPWQKSTRAISESAADAVSRPAERTSEAEPPRETGLMSDGALSHSERLAPGCVQ
jgi:DNA invertase Pin-like site-specific DNA recombinase